MAYILLYSMEDASAEEDPQFLKESIDASPRAMANIPDNLDMTC